MEGMGYLESCSNFSQKNAVESERLRRGLESRDGSNDESG